MKLIPVIFVFLVFAPILAHGDDGDLIDNTKQVQPNPTRQLSEKQSIEIRPVTKSLDLFYADCGRYPKTQEGLQALVSKPKSIDCKNWGLKTANGRKPYLNSVPKDLLEHWEYICKNGTSYDLKPSNKNGAVVIYPAKQISVSITRTPVDVYKFASNPENLSKWAAGLSSLSIKKSGKDWIADSPMGKIKIRFVEQNKFGVLDHDVTLPSGEVVHNPLRVTKNGDGSEVVFTLYRLPQTSEAVFEKDAGMVERDLQKLKSILEK